MSGKAGVQRRKRMREKPGFPGHSGVSSGARPNAGMGGWRRSADRARLQPNSLLTGNSTGKFAILVAQRPVPSSENAAPQQLFARFPNPTNREIFGRNRVLSGGNREFRRRSPRDRHKRSFLAHFSCCSQPRSVLVLDLQMRRARWLAGTERGCVRAKLSGFRCGIAKQFSGGLCRYLSREFAALFRQRILQGSWQSGRQESRGLASGID
jgi:hypothetical protein